MRNSKNQHGQNQSYVASQKVKNQLKKFQNKQGEEQAKYFEGIIPNDLLLRFEHQYNLDLNKATDSVIFILMLSSLVTSFSRNEIKNNKDDIKELVDDEVKNWEVAKKALSLHLAVMPKKSEIPEKISLFKAIIDNPINKNYKDNHLGSVLDTLKIIGVNSFETITLVAKEFDKIITSMITLPGVGAKTGNQIVSEFYEEMAKLQGNDGEIEITPRAEYVEDNPVSNYTYNPDRKPEKITLKQATENLVWKDKDLLQDNFLTKLMEGGDGGLLNFHKLFTQYHYLKSILENKIEFPDGRDKEAELALENILKAEKALLSDPIFKQEIDSNSTIYEEFEQRTKAIETINTISAINNIRNEIINFCNTVFNSSVTKYNKTDIENYDEETEDKDKIPLPFYFGNTKINKLFSDKSKEIKEIIGKNITSGIKVLKALRNITGIDNNTITTFCDINDDYGAFTEEFKEILDFTEIADLKFIDDNDPIKKGLILTKKILNPSFYNSTITNPVTNKTNNVSNIFDETLT